MGEIPGAPNHNRSHQRSLTADHHDECNSCEKVWTLQDYQNVMQRHRIGKCYGKMEAADLGQVCHKISICKGKKKQYLWNATNQNQRTIKWVTLYIHRMNTMQLWKLKKKKTMNLTRKVMSKRKCISVQYNHSLICTFFLLNCTLIKR